MTPVIARQILELLDSPDRVKALADYAASEIGKCHLNLEGVNDTFQMARFQGEIAALKRLKSLRDTAVQIVENEIGKTRNSTSGSR